MASPFVRVDADGQIVGSSDGKFTPELEQYLQSLVSGIGDSGLGPIATHTPGSIGDADLSATGVLLDTDTFDAFGITLQAGVTYSFAERGDGSNPLEDPYLVIANAGGQILVEDDDGGSGRTSLITFTPTVTGTYLIGASSWYQLFTTSDDPGADYRIDVWIADAANDVPGTLEDAVELDLGTNFGHLETAGDMDMYSIDVVEGMVYAFNYAGGISGFSDWEDPTTPGENIAWLDIFDSEGNLIDSVVNFESGFTYFAEQNDTIYVRVRPLEEGMTGGYTLDVEEIDPATRDPLEAILWDNAANVTFEDVEGVPTAYVYFTPAGENFGELADDGVSPMINFGWQQHEIDAVMLALEQYEHILGVNYEITTDVNQATFRLMTTSSEEFGAYFYPQDPAFGTQQGIGVFNVDSGGWGSFPQSLEQGGFSFAVILHEFGHAHGLSHAHDTGGGSEVMLGVTGATGSLGIYDLNQGVYTVMSYNDAWQTHPLGPSSFTIEGIDNGWSGTLSAFDIAALQARYGTHDYNHGDTVYALTDNADDAFYQTIWDSGGNDTISYEGSRSAQIDLTAATLDYSPTGGGVVSFVFDHTGVPASMQIKGGYTIANGVVIENASGGSGNDILIGNAAANTLTGNSGDDFLLGRDGDDLLLGGNGKDTLNGGAGDDTLNGGNGKDLFVFEDGGTDTIVGYETGEDIDLSALGVTGEDVTITDTGILVDLDGSEDLSILFNTKGFSMDDILFGLEPDALTTSSHGAGANADYLIG